MKAEERAGVKMWQSTCTLWCGRRWSAGDSEDREAGEVGLGPNTILTEFEF
jgi:hypothetical protein